MKTLSQRLEQQVHQTARKRVRSCTQPGILWNVVQSEIVSLLTDVLNQRLQREQDALLERPRYHRGGDRRKRNGYKSVKVSGFLRPLVLRRPVLRGKTPPSRIVSLLRCCGNGLVALIASRFWLRGASTRAVAAEVNGAFGTRITSSSVSEFTDALLPDVQAWMQRPITQTITHLFVDAIYLPVRRPGFTAKQALLSAIGIANDGTKHALGFLLGDRESADAWNALIRDLLNRGLNPASLRLVISDDHKAIVAAVAEQLNTPHQLCVVHKMRNALARVAAKNRKDFYADFKAVYWAQSPEDAQRALGRLEAKWGSIYPKATQTACANSEAFLRFHNEPQHLWRTLRSTNLIERFNREIRRRLNSVGTMHGENVLHKLLWSVATEQEKRWTKTKIPTVKQLKKAA